MDKAIELLERSMEICRVWDLPQNLPESRWLLGNAFGCDGACRRGYATFGINQRAS